MTTLLTLLFISLLGISFMLGRKLMLLRNGALIHVGNNTPQIIPNLNTIQYTLFKGTKRGTYVLTITMVRLYVKLGNFLKSKYETLKTRIENIGNNNASTGEKEVSKFLKMVSDYKYKVRSIKKYIEEEEKVK